MVLSVPTKFLRKDQALETKIEDDRRIIFGQLTRKV